MAAFKLKIARPREEFERLLQTQGDTVSMGFLVACAFELLLDIRELLLGLNLAAGASEGTSTGIVLPK